MAASNAASNPGCVTSRKRRLVSRIAAGGFAARERAAAMAAARTSRSGTSA